MVDNLYPLKTAAKKALPLGFENVLNTFPRWILLSLGKTVTIATNSDSSLTEHMLYKIGHVSLLLKTKQEIQNNFKSKSSHRKRSSWNILKGMARHNCNF